MAEITQSTSGPSFSSLLAPFTGVDNGSARLLKAISASELATLRNGDAVYVESIRDYWKWVPLSTATDDSTGAAAQLRYCNPTVNGANPGRFERLFICSPDWLLQDFFIDTGAAGHNENSGATALLPLNNDRELFQRWGVNTKLDTPRIVTYAQTPTIESNYSIRILSGGSLTIVGTQTITKSGLVLTAVAAQVRTPGAEVAWAITAPTLGAADVGNYAIITASGTPANVGAYARILKDNGGNSVRISPMGLFAVSDLTPFTQVIPAIGDTIKVVSISQLNVALFEVKSNAQVSTLAAPTRNCVVLDSILLEGLNTTLNGLIYTINTNIFYKTCTASNLSFGGLIGGVSFHRFCGGGFSGSCTVRAGSTLQVRQSGILNGSITSAAGGQVVILADTYFQNSQFSCVQGSIVSSQGAAWWDKATANTAITIAFGGIWRQSGAVADWGTVNAGHGIIIISGGQYCYVTKPTVNGTLGPGREAQIGGTDKVYGVVPYIEGANLAALTLAA